MKQVLAIIGVLISYSCFAQDDRTIPATYPVYADKDSAVVAASTQYGSPSWLRQLLLGRNYRAEWSTPVSLKIFRINEERGGLRITELGGGKQTISATLKDKTGKEWKLRTIDKDPAKAIPEQFRSSIAAEVVQDMISASHPYGTLIIPGLSAAVGVPSTNPQLFFVPDDTAFGKYRELFANKVCMLEEKDATADNSDAKNTDKALEKLHEEGNIKIDQEAVLKARLLDICIADWDRHFDQWKWGITDTGENKIAYPVPKDRDQAFFYSDGLVPKYIALRRMPFLEGFRYKISNINWLGFSARDFDRVFMNEMDESTWRHTISDFQANLTDSVIYESVKKLPPGIYALNGRTIEEKLKSRKRQLMSKGMTYYRFLSKRVNILGSDQQEYFMATGDDTSLLVRVYPNTDSAAEPLYSRRFDPRTTKEIRIYGFGGNDYFHVAKSASSNIKLRMVGGKGNDSFDLDGTITKHIYDLSTENNRIVNSRKTKNHFAPDTGINSFSYQQYRYVERHKFPWITAGYNPEDGFLLGLGFQLQTYGFRKEPFATESRLVTLYSFTGKAYQAKYTGTFTDIIGKADLVANAEFQNPALSNFFGFGNETQKQPGTDLYFYRTRYKFVAADLQARIATFKNTNLSIGPSFYHYWSLPGNNAGRILENPEILGLDSNSIYNTKTYAGGRLNVVFDNINNDIFPTEGVSWNNEFHYLHGINNNSRPLAKLQSNLITYKNLAGNKKLVGVLRAGGGHIFSNDPEYFQALTLGANTYLRGFRKNRFSGTSMLYGSMELRYKLIEINSYIMPGTLGLIAYNDAGRVWIPNEDSKRLHYTYGGGVYFLPFNLLILSATIGISPEEALFNISLGTKLNIIF